MANVAFTATITERRITLVPLAAVVLGTGTMTAANPIVVTANTHGLVTGDYISFTAIAQSNWTALNGTSNKITKLTVNTFSIAVDGSGFGAYTDATGAIQQDFDIRKYWPHGIRWSGGEFKAAANDELIIRFASGTGGIVLDIVENGLGKEMKIGGKSLKSFPFLLMAEQTFSQPSTTKIIFEWD